MDIYAPLAERMGMQEMKNELEDLAFAELNPHARDSILARLSFLREHGGVLIPCIIGQLNGTLRANDLEADIVGREKTPYSIWQKMQRNNLNFEQLCDIMAFSSNRADAGGLLSWPRYRARRLPSHPWAICDYISTPKPNGYRSLHTGVLAVPSGSGSKFRYAPSRCTRLPSTGSPRTGISKGIAQPNGRQYRWLRELLEILDAGGPEEFLEHQARDVPGRGILLHSKGRPDQFADWRHSGRLLTPCTQKSAISAWEPRSTAV